MLSRWLLLTLLILLPWPLVAKEQQRVVIVANRQSPVSLRVAEYYRAKRQIPKDHVFTVDLPDSSLRREHESISYALYQERLAQPLRAWLKAKKLTDHVRYIVLTKGIPVRVRGVTYTLGSGQKYLQNQSVDSTLAQLDYRGSILELRDGKRLLGIVTPNLYWRQTSLFDHGRTGGYLVTRLDGYTEGNAKGLVDRALAPRKPGGRVLLDPARRDAKGGRPQPRDVFDPGRCQGTMPRCDLVLGAVTNGDYNDDLHRAGARVASVAPQLMVRFAEPGAFISDQDLVGYVSWGSNDEYFDGNRYRALGFRPGAIVDTAVSTSARTFLPVQGGQSLIADLVARADGCTGARGYVNEPYLVGVGSPSVLLEAYLGGANLATAYYSSTRFLGWQDLVLGDPLALFSPVPTGTPAR